MPLIAVAPASRNDDYLESARRAGAEPWLLDRAQDAPADVVRRVAGLMLLGGADVEPSRYGEAPHSTFQASETQRDEYETELITLALERDLPLLAVCRGIQILNVVLGGTLIQDIPSQTSSVIQHALAPGADAQASKAVVAHEVSVTSGTRLHAILGSQLDARGMCGVNSRHHQAVKDLGRGLVVTATAPDGIIEAIERPASTFCVGVQWHPENFLAERPSTPQPSHLAAPTKAGASETCREDAYNFAALFRAFVNAARGSRL
jgi:putative glutamine amidotransferase